MLARVAAAAVVRPTLTRLTTFAVHDRLRQPPVDGAPCLHAFLCGRAGRLAVDVRQCVRLRLPCASLQDVELQSLWVLPQPPRDLADALSRFWFDVTKSDWRDTMVMNVPRSMLADHVAMYWFDLTQQFGSVVPALAAVGWVGLARNNWRRAVLLLLLFAANVVFAFSYNVGDSHVFYLPSHLVVALLVAPAIVLIGRSGMGVAPAAAAALMAAALRGYPRFPALDRSHDRRQPKCSRPSLTASMSGALPRPI